VPAICTYGLVDVTTVISISNKQESIGQLEQHISGDIAVAVRDFWYVTNDMEWLQSVGFPLVQVTPCLERQ